ncbi:MAG: Lysine exporter protein [Gemmatimonadetes bacterium]|jgi:threonine/homoserine/homoserine lactone efflux protein|nr:Lysine exporter protein [Gemmatimonadota bacterium]
MPELHSLALFLAAGLALNITPGPDMLYVAARGASEGRAAGVVSALGIGAGTLVHIALVAGGLAALLAAVPVAYLVVRLGGAIYLVWLGVRALRATPAARAAPPAPASLGAIFRQGVITNVLNPKVALFFLAFLPQFVDPSRGPPALQVVALGLLFDLSGTLVNLAVAIGSSGAASRLRTPSHGGAVLQRLTGGIFIGLGLRLAWTARR